MVSKITAQEQICGKYIKKSLTNKGLLENGIYAAERRGVGVPESLFVGRLSLVEKRETKDEKGCRARPILPKLPGGRCRCREAAGVEVSGFPESLIVVRLSLVEKTKNERRKDGA